MTLYICYKISFRLVGHLHHRCVEVFCNVFLKNALSLVKPNGSFYSYQKVGKNDKVLNILKYQVIIDSIISNLTLLKKIIYEQQDPGRHGEYHLCKVFECMAGYTSENACPYQSGNLASRL